MGNTNDENPSQPVRMKNESFISSQCYASAHFLFFFSNALNHPKLYNTKTNQFQIELTSCTSFSITHVYSSRSDWVRSFYYKYQQINWIRKKSSAEIAIRTFLIENILRILNRSSKCLVFTWYQHQQFLNLFGNSA